MLSHAASFGEGSRPRRSFFSPVIPSFFPYFGATRVFSP
ncbi:MAG: hypothetical protein BLITH_0039 [Brockia lithotrophica]|uniref:Uncharacterized protein n=1 Tax=Brockia lithotrophica TaxID=933949 RepID=A0A2T5G4W7_9BACL|nr:MAG: hypothetical protein BLITH_0039 [Brockia lithotrophica]